MATKIGLGIPMPLLTPVTATWAAPFAFYYLFLQNRVVFHRLSNKAYMGHNTDSSKSGDEVKDPLYIANRAQVNFVENVPIAFIIATLAELNGANRTYLGYGLGALFALRVSHVEFGMMTEGALGAGRPIGYYGTQVVMAGLAGYLAYLVKDFWQIWN